MTQQTFQAVLARLVVDPTYRDLVRSQGERALPSDLNELQRQRLIFAAGNKGIDITGTLHKGFRLGKILSMLPLTCALLGNKRLAREVDLFWQQHSSRSFYYLEEALAFCDFIQKRLRAGLRIVYLEEVVEYESARLELQQPLIGEDAPQPRQIRFSHDPEKLLVPLARGRRPRNVPKRSCLLAGSLGSDGSIEWAITPADGNADAASQRDYSSDFA